MISLENVSKRYGELYAVKDLSFTVEQGEFCCLIGPSGCGKSTTLKMVNRMIEPSGGTITVAGEDIAESSPEKLRRSMGYVIQSIGLFPHMTVTDNIRVVPRLLGWEEEKSRKRAMELLELFELAPAEFADKYPSELSGGQAQRVGVARAMAADPKILLMDEPFGALDPINREHLQDRFLAIQSELKKTILFVTHDIDEAVRLGSKVALLRDGELVQYDSPETLLSSPVNSFVKKFVGLDRALKRLSRMQVKDFVRPAGQVRRDSPADALHAEFKRMEEQDCARYLWVTDAEGKLVGWIDGEVSNGNVDMEEDLVVVDVGDMSVKSGHSLKQALSMFVQQGVACLPVLDDQSRLRGEIRLADVLES